MSIPGNLCLREIREKIEEEILSPFASLSSKSKGRMRPDEPCSVRTEYQRDRDRILYSKSFRRLMQKTQVFIAPEGDHYRTRLTHTLEVSQISRTIARALRLNEDLTEAIALGHDLGHAPFGHAGEKALDDLMKKYSQEGFHHSRQSLRVVDFLERDGGLNLTWEVRNGIIAHTKGKGDIAAKGLFAEPKTLEGAIVRYADRLAYINHDIDDAIRAGIIREEDIPADLREIFGTGISQRVDTMVMDIVNSSWEKPKISMSQECREGVDRLKNFMFEKVYSNSPAKREDHKAHLLIEQLFDYFMENPMLIPPYISKRGGKGELSRAPFKASPHWEKSAYDGTIDDEDLELRTQAVCDYIAGMTDRYAVLIHNELFIPKSWASEVLT